MLLPAGLALVAVKFAVDDLARAAGHHRAAAVGHRRLSPPSGRGRRPAATTGCAAATTSSGCRPTRSRWARSATSRSSAAVTDGILTERVDAATATDHPGRLAPARTSTRSQRRRAAASSRLRDARLARQRSTSSASSSWPARRASSALGQLREIIAAGGYGLRAREPYLTWLHQRHRRRVRADVPDDAGLRAGPPVQPHGLDRAGVHGRASPSASRS